MNTVEDILKEYKDCRITDGIIKIIIAKLEENAMRIGSVAIVVLK